MSRTVTVPQSTHYIHHILPMVNMYYKLDTLLTNISPQRNEHQPLIVIAVEHNNRTRSFLALMVDELTKLLNYLQPSNRTLYEILCQNNLCKLYFDFDIYIEKTQEINVHESLFILQSLFHHIISNITNQSVYNSTSIGDNFLVLSASTAKKHSYHLIYTNTLIRFESQQTILTFILTILHHCSYFILSHACQLPFSKYMNVNEKFNPNKCLTHLQTILTHTNLCQCIIPATSITCHNFEKLLYKDSNGSYQWVFDLHVYKKNQQFRLYKSTKLEQNNHLLPTSQFPFSKQNEHDYITMNNNANYDPILIHSLISYTENRTDLLVISYKKNKWLFIDQDKKNTTDLPITNYLKFFPSPNTSPLNETQSHITTTTTPQSSNKQEPFKDTILKIITDKYNTTGYIQSCQQGTKNHALFFYNIGGLFRFCERLQRHHKSNQTCIIVDTLTYKYQIKCKDPDCQTFKPPWKKISDLNK